MAEDHELVDHIYNNLTGNDSDEEAAGKMQVDLAITVGKKIWCGK